MSSELYTLKSATIDPMVHSTLNNDMIVGLTVPVAVFTEAVDHCSCEYKDPKTGVSQYDRSVRAVESALERFPKVKESPCFIIASDSKRSEWVDLEVYAVRDMDYNPYWYTTEDLPGRAVHVGYLQKHGREWRVCKTITHPTIEVSLLAARYWQAKNGIPMQKVATFKRDEDLQGRVARDIKIDFSRAGSYWSPKHLPQISIRKVRTHGYSSWETFLTIRQHDLPHLERVLEWSAMASRLADAQKDRDAERREAEIAKLVGLNGRLKESKERAIADVNEAVKKYWDEVYRVDEELEENFKALEARGYWDSNGVDGVIDATTLLPGQPNYSGDLSDPRSSASPSQWRYINGRLQ